jgi:methylated-DNA-protein-cysteine methyltransferase-like protein
MSQQHDFFERVYEVVRRVPYGKVTTYGTIARLLGAARSARTVGYAMNAAHALEDVPAHRVVNRNGMLTGKHHFGGINTMQQLLEAEGHIIINDEIQDFDSVLWSPNE